MGGDSACAAPLGPTPDWAVAMDPLIRGHSHWNKVPTDAADLDHVKARGLQLVVQGLLEVKRHRKARLNKA